MKILVKPKSESIQVRKPDGKPLAKTGEQVTRTAFWIRRIKDGDVVTVKSITPATKAVAQPAKDKKEGK